MSDPSSRPRAVIIQHEDLEGPGRLAPALRRVGFALEEQRRSASRSEVDAELVVVMGGPMRVYPGESGMVIGVWPVTLSPEAMADPLFAGFDEEFETVHWHGDTFDPVPGAVRLASTARYPWEAFRVGNSFGLQFHPELDEATFTEWVHSATSDMQRAGRRNDEVLARDLPLLRASEHANQLLMERLADFFAREVKGCGVSNAGATAER